MAISGLSTGIDLASRLPRDTRDEFTSEYRERLERELEAQLERRASDDAIADVVDLSQTDAAHAFDETDAIGATDAFLGGDSTTRAYSSPPAAVLRDEFADPGEQIASAQPSGASSSPYLSIAIAAYGTRQADAEQAVSRLSVRA